MMNQLTVTKLISTLCLFALLSGCGSIAIKPEHAQHINRIGVISFLGNDFRVYDFGLTIFERRDHKRVDLPKWSLDAVVQNAIKDELTNKSRFSYVPVSKGKDVLQKIHKSVSGNIEEGVNEAYVSLPRFENIAKDLKHLGDTNKIDTWILVYPDRGQSPIVPRELYITGVGAIRELTMVGKKAAIFSQVSVKVVTANSGEEIAWLTADGFENIDIATWETANKLPDSDMPQNTISVIKGMINTQLKGILARMQLTQ
jgi:hypothetical protein